MSHIKKTEFGTYRAFTVIDGKKVGRTFKKKGLAQDWLDETTGKVRSGDYVDPKAGRTTFGAHVEDFYRRQFDLRASTVSMDQDVLAHILPKWGAVPLSEIVPEDLTDWYGEKLREEKRKGTGTLSRAYVHRMHKVTRKILNDAVERKLIARNPAAEKACRPPTPGDAEMTFLTQTEVKALADALPDHYRAWCLVMAYTGIRWGEAAGLRRMDVEGKGLRVFEQLAYTPGQGHRRGPVKTGASERMVYMPPAVAAVLGDHLATRVDDAPDSLLFLNRNRRPLIHSTFTTHTFKPAVLRAGLPANTRIHDLRHTCVAFAIAAGGHPSAIQALLGHKSIKTTLDTYGHLFPHISEGLAEDMSPVV